MSMTDVVARFTRMEDGTKEEYLRLEEAQAPFAARLADRVLEHLRLLEGSYGGMLVDRLTHSLQAATRAHRDGRDEEYVVCALYDRCSFDPDYDTLPLATFEPMLRRLFARPKWSEYES